MLTIRCGLSSPSTTARPRRVGCPVPAGDPRGGGDEPSNLVSLCDKCHLSLVHGGHLTVTGQAPHALDWSARTYRADSTPLEHLVHDQPVLSVIAEHHCEGSLAQEARTDGVNLSIRPCERRSIE